MKLTSPFTIIRNALNKKSLDEISCLVDDVEVPVKECGFELEVEKNLSDLDFWHEECEGHSNNSHCKVYDD